MALVISIIVLLILATVSINLVINNGILDKAKTAVDKYLEGEIEEQIKLAFLEYEQARLTKTNIDIEDYMEENLEKVLNEPISVEKVGKDIKITFTNRDKIYKYYSNGIVKELMKVSKNLYGRLDKTTNTLYLRATAKDNYDIFNKWSVYYYIIEKQWDKTKIEKIIIEEPIAPSTTYSMFSNLSSLTTIEGIDNLHTENSDSMYAMFMGCSLLNNINISNFDTSNVKTMHQMFQGCNSLKNITIGKINTGNVAKMSSMFTNCKELTSLDVSSFDTSNVISINSMFSGCNKLTEIDLSNFDTSSLTDMNYLCNKTISKLNLSGKFKINQNTSYLSMFGWVGSSENLSIKIKCNSDDKAKIMTAYPNLTENNFE